MKLVALSLALSVVSITTGFAEDIPRVLSAEEQLAQTPAQQNCGPLDEAIKILAEKFHETPAASMLADSGVMIAIFAAPDGSTFTIMAVQPNGIACETLSGTTFAIAPAPSPAVPGRGA